MTTIAQAYTTQQVDALVNTKANQTDVTALSGVVNTKADKTALDATNEEVNKLKDGGGIPLGFVTWWHDRTTIPAGWLPADGQLVLRSQYPQFWAYVAKGNTSHLTSDGGWLQYPDKRGLYSDGDFSTNFRLPDLNGKQSGSRAVVLRGDGNNSDGRDGYIQSDAIRNIVGGLGASAKILDATNGHGAIVISQPSGVASPMYTSQVVTKGTFDFDASRVVPTANENRMVNATGCFIIKAYGAAVNTGTMDASKLQQAIDAANSRVSGILDGKRLPSAITFNKENSLTEGGQLTLEHPYDPSLNLNIDLVDNASNQAKATRIRFFTVGSGSKGAFLDIAGSAGGAGSQIMSDAWFRGNASTHSDNGWTKLPNSIIFQWGSLSLPAVGNYNTRNIGGTTFYTNSYRVYFHIPFPIHCSNIVGDLHCPLFENQSSIAGYSVAFNRTSDDTLKSFTVAVTTPDLGYIPYIFWRATGY